MLPRFLSSLVSGWFFIVCETEIRLPTLRAVPAFAKLFKRQSVVLCFE